MANLGLQNNNPGNLKDPTTGQFRVFSTPQEGQQALMADLQLKQSGGSSVIKPGASLSQFASVWAPSSDNNNPANYANTLATHLGVSPNTPFDQVPADKLAGAIQVAEGTSTMPQSAPTTGGQLTHAQLIANINAMEQQGAKPAEVQGYLDSLKGGTTPPPAAPAAPEASSALFPSNPGTDTPLVAGLKATGNFIPSAAGLVKNVAEGASGVQIPGTLGKIASGFDALKQQEGAGQAILDTIKGLPKATYDVLVPSALRKAISGDVSGAEQDVVNDPAGQAGQFVLSLLGGAEALDKVTGATVDAPLSSGKPITVDPQGTATLPQDPMFSSALDKGISAVGGKGADILGGAASLATKPLSLGLDAAKSIGTSLASHLTALNPETIQQIIETPDAFSKIAQDQMNRSSIFDDVKAGLQTLQNAYSETGNLYNAAKASTETVTVPEDFLSDSLAKHGIQLTTDATTGKQTVVADSNSITRNPADINAIQNFVDNWGDKTTLTPKEFLNMRSDMGKISKFGKDVGTNRDAATVGKTLYADANKAMRPQIQGLKTLDETASPQIDLIKRVKKDLMNADGTFKDNAPSKIANALNKEGLMSRLDKLSPGIAKRIEILKAVEDIEHAKGIKVGAYSRGIIEGYLLDKGFGAVIAAVVSNPTVATYIFRGLGWSNAKVGAALSVVKTLAGDVGNTANNSSGNIQNAVAAGAISGRAQAQN